MYLEVSCLLRLLYYIYILIERHNAIQPIIIHNLFLQHCNQSLVFFILKIFRFLQPCRPRGDRSRIHRGQRSWFAVDPIDPTAFVALVSSYTSRLKVSASRWWWLYDRTTSKMRDLPSKIIPGDSRRSENTQTQHTSIKIILWS
jgi:hypothetical protein